MTVAKRRAALPGGALIVCALAMAALAPAAAQEPGGTLATIKKTGIVKLGVRDDSLPFVFVDDRQHYAGYTVDLCDQIMASLRTQLRLPSLQAVWVPVTAANRIAKVSNGSVDLECGSTTNNLERQRLVAFAPTMFVISARLLTKKAAHIENLADLRGKTLVAVAGTSTLKQMQRLNQERRLGVKIVVAGDNQEAFMLLDTGRVVAEANDDILLASQVASAKRPTDYVIGSEAMSVEPYAIMLRKGDPGFKKTVDAALVGLYKSGVIHAIYAKWFTQPIPGSGINMNFPMPAALRAVIAKPTDSGVASAYAAPPDAKGSGGARSAAN